MQSDEQGALYGELYGTARTREIFSVRGRVRAMLAFERALARAEGIAGVIPHTAADAIARAAGNADAFDAGTLIGGTERTGYPVVPLTRELARLAGGDAGGYVHWGATTQDVLDTATVLQLRDALPALEADLDATIAALAERAARHRNDVMAGRTHMQHALPVTFGYVCALWLAPLLDELVRLRAARDRALQLQFAGAAGTLASLGSNARAVALALGEELGLPVPDVPWHADRSAFAELVCALAVACGSLAKIAGDVALLMQTEVGEVFEPHEPGRGASSAMPHKRNPIASEYVIACARAVHGLVPVMLAATAGDHQRSTGAYQSEENTLYRVVIHASGAFAGARGLTSGLSADPVRMRANLALTHGLIVSEAVAMALADRVGSGRAHALVERAAAAAIDRRKPLLDVLDADPEVSQQLDHAALRELLDPVRYTGEAGAIVDRVLTRVNAMTPRLAGVAPSDDARIPTPAKERP